MAKIGQRLGEIRISAISQNKKRLEVSLQKDLHPRESFQRLSKELGSKSSQ